MGEAKRRGTFEERKAQAIAAGRVKVKTENKYSSLPIRNMGLGQMIPSMDLLTLSLLNHNKRVRK